MSRDIERRFVNGGKPGPGRPKGSRSKLGEAFLSALADDFSGHGAAAIARVREEDPSTYVRVCASLMPKEVKLDEVKLADMTDAQLLAIIMAAAAGDEGDAPAPAGGVH